MSVKKVNYHDPKNMVPEATLYWEGPGWYGTSEVAFEHVNIVLVSKDKTTLPENWTHIVHAVQWADTKEEAAGNYSGFEVK